MRRTLILLLILSLGAAFASAGEISPELAERLASAEPGERIPVIVRMAETVDLSAFPAAPALERAAPRARLIVALKATAARSQAALRRFLATRDIVPRVLWSVNRVAATVPAELVPWIADTEGVSAVTLDGTVKAPKADAGTSASPPEWGIAAVRAPEMWSEGVLGAGVIVATLDTGVDALHPDLAPSYRGGGNSWFDPYGQHASPYDASGHGTQVLGLIVGGDAGGSAIGVAPGARWIAAKVFDDAGYATLSAIHAAFQWALDPDGSPATDDGAHVINCSWNLATAGACDDEFAADLATLETAGTAVVFAAGNEGPAAGTSVSPANNASALPVGALDGALELDPSSSRGPSACDGSTYPLLAAPGVAVRTADLTLGGVFPSSYVYVSGTSFAAPHVAGGLALLIEAQPAATVTELRQALLAGATDLGVTGPDNDFGSGLVDLVAARTALGGGQPGVNQPPVAADDSATTRRNTSATIAVLANDTDPDGSLVPDSVEVLTTPANGTATTNPDGTITYAPRRGFKGTDSFTYRVADDQGAFSNAATVAVRVR